MNLSEPTSGQAYDSVDVDGFVDPAGIYQVGDPVYCHANTFCLPLSVTSATRFSHVVYTVGMATPLNVSPANLLVNLQKEQKAPPTMTSLPSSSNLDVGMGCGIAQDGSTLFLGFLSQFQDCAASRALHGNYTSQFNMQFFATSGDVEASQVVDVCTDSGSDRRVAVAFQSFNAGSWAESKYTTSIIGCALSGTYSFADWWTYFFGGE